MKAEQLKQKLQDVGLKVTPQRLAILEAINKLDTHPTAEEIIDYIRKSHPSIATGTVYKVLDTLAENRLIRRVKTEKDVMRYDGVMEHHHHMYCSTCDVIRDYIDPELDELLNEYFKKKKLEGFNLQEIRLQLRGNFDDC